MSNQHTARESHAHTQHTFGLLLFSTTTPRQRWQATCSRLCLLVFSEITPVSLAFAVGLLPYPYVYHTGDKDSTTSGTNGCLKPSFSHTLKIVFFGNTSSILRPFHINALLGVCTS